jgi:putative transposase
VSQLAGEFSVNLLCGLVELAPSTFYYQPQEADELELRNAIEEIALEYPRYGYRRITAELKRRG